MKNKPGNIKQIKICFQRMPAKGRPPIQYFHSEHLNKVTDVRFCCSPSDWSATGTLGVCFPLRAIWETVEECCVVSKVPQDCKLPKKERYVCRTWIRVSELFTKFIAAFQKNEPLVHVLHAGLKDLLLTVLARLLKPDILMSAYELPTIFLENLDSSLQNAIVGDPVGLMLDIQELTLAERHGFRWRTRRHFKAAAKHLTKKYPISSNSLHEGLRCLDPTRRKRVEFCQI